MFNADFWSPHLKKIFLSIAQKERHALLAYISKSLNLFNDIYDKVHEISEKFELIANKFNEIKTLADTDIKPDELKKWITSILFKLYYNVVTLNRRDRYRANLEHNFCLDKHLKLIRTKSRYFYTTGAVGSLFMQVSPLPAEIGQYIGGFLNSEKNKELYKVNKDTLAAAYENHAQKLAAILEILVNFGIEETNRKLANEWTVISSRFCKDEQPKTVSYQAQVIALSQSIPNQSANAQESSVANIHRDMQAEIKKQKNIANDQRLFNKHLSKQFSKNQEAKWKQARSFNNKWR